MLRHVLLPLIVIAAPFPVRAQSAYHAIQLLDGRVQSVGWKLARTNAAFCNRKMLMTGLLLQDVDDYRDPQQARQALGLAAPVAVQAVAAGSPAETAGLRANQPVVAINGVTVDQIAVGEVGATRLGKLHNALEIPVGSSAALTIARGNDDELSVTGDAVCASRFEMHLRDGLRAMSDGDRVVIFREMVEATQSDEELAVILAHELAHNLLGHPAALAETGRGSRSVRATETQADQLVVWLLANAGFDPQIAPQFWRRLGPRIDHGIFTASTHLRWRSRVRLLEAEIALLPPADQATGLRDWRPRFSLSQSPR